MFFKIQNYSFFFHSFFDFYEFVLILQFHDCIIEILQSRFLQILIGANLRYRLSSDAISKLLELERCAWSRIVDFLK